MDEDLKSRILQANIELHKKEAKYYDTLHAEIYSEEQTKLINTILHNALKTLKRKGLKVLDIGAGVGNITLKLCSFKEINTVTAIDLSVEMLSELKKKMIGLKGAEKVTTVASDAGAFLAQNTQTYDVITTSAVLHHIPDYIKVIDQIFDCLKDDGIYMIFLEPTGEKSRLLHFLMWLDIFIFLRFCLPKELKQLALALDYTLSDYHMLHGFSLKNIKRILRSHKDVSIIYQVKYNIFHLSFFRFLGRLIKNKNNFILTLQKKPK